MVVSRSVSEPLGTLGMAGEVGESGETLLLADDDSRLADIIEGASWSSADSEPLAGHYLSSYPSLPPASWPTLLARVTLTLVEFVDSFVYDSVS